jgi:hypothetical protein
MAIRLSQPGPKLAGKFYAIIGVSIAVGLAFDFADFNAVKMLLWSAILNGLLALLS